MEYENKLNKKIHLKDEDIISISLDWIETKSGIIPYDPKLVCFCEETEDIIVMDLELDNSFPSDLDTLFKSL